MGATIVVFLSEGQSPAGDHSAQPVVFGAAAVGVAAWRTFSPLAGSDEPAGPQIFGGRTRAALEREKALVLRSIKDLEFDHAMGKVSDKDFAEMGARLRARAAGLMRQLDAGHELSARRSRRRSTSALAAGRTWPATRCWPATRHRRAGLVRPAGRGTAGRHEALSVVLHANDPDARFCKGCGYQLGNW